MAAAVPYFGDMNEAQLRQWVEANPGRVNDRDSAGYTLLTAAALEGEEEDGLLLTFIVWLLDEEGADVNATAEYRRSALHHGAGSLDILNALMDRAADPTMADRNGALPLMCRA